MNLTPFIVTKMVHDLAGCAGAVLNTAELLALDGESAGEVAPLLNESAQVLVTRLKFFRCLFGSKTDVPPDIAARYLKTLSMPFEVRGEFVTPIDLGIVLWASDVLPKGGVIERTEAGIRFSGPAVQVDEMACRILQGGDAQLTPHTAVLFWLHDTLAARNQVVDIQVDGECVLMKLK